MHLGYQGENQLCDAMAFDGFQWHLLKRKFYTIEISLIEIRIQKYINQVSIPN